MTQIPIGCRLLDDRCGLTAQKHVGGEEPSALTSHVRWPPLRWCSVVEAAVRDIGSAAGGHDDG